MLMWNRAKESIAKTGKIQLSEKRVYCGGHTTEFQGDTLRIGDGWGRWSAECGPTHLSGRHCHHSHLYGSGWNWPKFGFASAV